MAGFSPFPIVGRIAILGREALVVFPIARLRERMARRAGRGEGSFSIGSS